MPITNSELHLLRATFNLPLHPRDIPRWRGAFIEMVGRRHDLFHNHLGESQLHYRYPRIHYRVSQGQASLFALNEGIPNLQTILTESDWYLNWNDSRFSLTVETVETERFRLRSLEEFWLYKLDGWVGFNQPNYQRWKSCEGLAEKILLIEEVLTGHILRFGEEVNWSPQAPLVVKVQELCDVKSIRVHHNQMSALSLTYKANVALPDDISFGKGVSKGWGVQQLLSKS